ncbi:MAG: hypothetical protein GXY48_05725 [Methanomicrobiales archaeon]|nr:hypothetical protein [Methanomicrobiales archaeon]
MVLVVFLVLSLTMSVSALVAWSSSTQYQSSSGCTYSPFMGTRCGSSSSFSQQQSMVSTGPGPVPVVAAPPPGPRIGGFWGPAFGYNVWNYGGYVFFANGSQMEDVTGVWDVDLLGEMNLKLTGDDIIRGSYQNGDHQGYIQGNFSAENETLPVMTDGIWFEEPSFQPPYSLGVIEITFLNDTELEGVFSYSDGTWGPFTGKKTSGTLTEETEEKLMNMPEANWTINMDEEKNYLVSNSLENNPIMDPAEDVSEV